MRPLLAHAGYIKYFLPKTGKHEVWLHKTPEFKWTNKRVILDTVQHRWLSPSVGIAAGAGAASPQRRAPGRSKTPAHAAAAPQQQPGPKRQRREGAATDAAPSTQAPSTSAPSASARRLAPGKRRKPQRCDDGDSKHSWSEGEARGAAAAAAPTRRTTRPQRQRRLTILDSSDSDSDSEAFDGGAAAALQPRRGRGRATALAAALAADDSEDSGREMHRAARGGGADGATSATRAAAALPAGGSQGQAKAGRFGGKRLASPAGVASRGPALLGLRLRDFPDSYIPDCFAEGACRTNVVYELHGIKWFLWFVLELGILARNGRDACLHLDNHDRLHCS